MKTIGMLALTIAVSVSVLSGCSSEAAKELPAKPVKVKAVEKHTSAQPVRYSASIRAAAQVDVAFKVAGNRVGPGQTE